LGFFCFKFAVVTPFSAINLSFKPSKSKKFHPE